MGPVKAADKQTNDCLTTWSLMSRLLPSGLEHVRAALGRGYTKKNFEAGLLSRSHTRTVLLLSSASKATYLPTYLTHSTCIRT